MPFGHPAVLSAGRFTRTRFWCLVRVPSGPSSLGLRFSRFPWPGAARGAVLGGVAFVGGVPAAVCFRLFGWWGRLVLLVLVLCLASWGAPLWGVGGWVLGLSLVRCRLWWFVWSFVGGAALVVFFGLPPLGPGAGVAWVGCCWSVLGLGAFVVKYV